MNPQWLVSGIFLLLFLIIIMVAQRMYKASMDPEKSRKFVHVAGGTLSLFLPLFIDSQYYVLGLCSIAFLVLLITHIRKQLPSIHQTKRKSIGSIIFPIPVYLCFASSCINNNELLFYIPVSLLTFSDTVAELGGKKWGKYTPSLWKGQKTLAGSFCFLLSAAAITAGWLFFYDKPNIELVLLVTITSTVAEMISLRGWDNLTVPLTALWMMGLYL